MMIATWNVNSVRTRKDRIVAWLRKHRPDVLCLQELKCVREAYPFEAFDDVGYRSAVWGQKAYNGVALLSKHELEDVRIGFGAPSREQARLISARVRGVDVISAYFPNGKSVGTRFYDYKLSWMERLLEHLEQRYSPKDAVVLAGDFNVARSDKDAQNPEDWKSSVLCHAEAKAKLEAIRRWGFRDIFRKHNPEGGIYSWWDYRRLAFPRNDGLRIDYVFATEALNAVSTGAWADRDQRKGGKSDKPSDHVPVVATFSESG